MNPLQDLTPEEKLERRKAQLQVIEEGNLCEQFLKSNFWGIFRRTLQAQKAAYLADCYDAAKLEDKSVRNFLGRCENIDWVMGLMESDFLEARKGAFQQMQDDARLEKEQHEIDEGVREETDHSTQPGQSTGLT